MLFLYSLTAIFIAWIWVDYYRLIDIYEPEKLKNFLLVFCLGGVSVFLVFFIDDLIFSHFNWGLNGNLLNDFLYCSINIGMLEEFSKLVPFLIFYKLFKKQVNEPIDYVAYICVSALGFSAAENILYFNNYGPQIIYGRAILASVGHMMFAAFTAYGIIRYKYKKTKLGLVEVFLFFCLGSASHGLYDFWLMFEETSGYGLILTAFFFLESISLFAIIMNNALNNSEFFTYKKVIDTDKVSNRLMLYYFIVFILQFTFIVLERDIESAFRSISLYLIFIGFLVFVATKRLGRFKLIKGKWFPLKLELPFAYSKVYSYDGKNESRRFSFRGESYNEVYLNRFYKEEFYICPLSKRKTDIEKPRLAYIEKKIFLHADETYYVCKVYLDEAKTKFDYYLLKPKLIGKKFTSKKSPIIALLRMRNYSDMDNKNLKMSQFQFVEWAYPKSQATI
jgi:RsiW-degrading membrane proteinase PrsW (M82 family)